MRNAHRLYRFNGMWIWLPDLLLASKWILLVNPLLCSITTLQLLFGSNDLLKRNVAFPEISSSSLLLLFLLFRQIKNPTRFQLKFNFYEKRSFFSSNKKTVIVSLRRRGHFAPQLCFCFEPSSSNFSLK